LPRHYSTTDQLNTAHATDLTRTQQPHPAHADKSCRNPSVLTHSDDPSPCQSRPGRTPPKPTSPVPTPHVKPGLSRSTSRDPPIPLKPKTGLIRLYASRQSLAPRCKSDLPLRLRPPAAHLPTTRRA